MISRPPAALAALALLIACSTNTPQALREHSQSLAADQTLRVRLAEPIGTADPAQARTTSDLALVRQYTEPLLRPAPNMQDAEPAAAESFETSADGLTLVFHLRANARYSDGRPLRSEDFVYAWTRLVDPRTVSPSADTFASLIKGGEAAASLDPKRDATRIDAALAALGLKAPDDSTFVVTLARPTGHARWIATLPQGAPLRRDILESAGPDWAAKPAALIGNGPYKVVQLDPKTGAELAAADDYWGGRPTLRRIAYEVIPDPAVAQARYQSGGLDIAGVETGEAGGKDLVKVPALTEFWLYFNVARPPLDSPQVRLALARLAPRDAIVKTVFAGRAQPALSLIPQGMRGYQPDPGRAQERDSGAVPKEQLIGAQLLTLNRPADQAVADAYAAAVKQALGVSLDVQAVDQKTYRQRLRDGDFAIAGPGGWTADYPDQQNWFDLFRTNDGNNRGHWRNARYDLLVRQADAELDQGKRDQLYSQAQQLLVQEMPVVFLVQQQSWYLVKPYVKGLTNVPVQEWPGSVYSSRAYIGAHG